MFTFVGLCLWLASLFVATYVGYDRGRWAAGFALGLLAGPLGALVAGQLEPSLDHAVVRGRALQRRLSELQRQERIALDQARRKRMELDAWVEDVQRQITGEGHAD
jgi:hypothetical protein